MASGYGRRSSALDEIRPEHWTAQLTEELLEVIWVLEATVSIQPALSALLKEIVSGPIFAANELPQPEPTERDPPAGDDQSEESSQLEFY
jgi:hypothetical protein